MATANEPKKPIPRPATAPAGLDAHLHKGSLRSKLVMSLAGVFMIFLIVDEVVRSRVIEPEFAALERAGAIRDASRVMAAINAEVEHLGVMAQQMASQISTEDHSPASDASSESTFVPVDPTGLSESLDWVAILTGEESFLWISRPEASAKQNTDSVDVLNQHILEIVQVAEDNDSKTSGLTRLGDSSPSLISVAPIDGPTNQPKQHLIIARDLNIAFQQTLQRQTQVKFDLEKPRDAKFATKWLLLDADPSVLVAEVHLTGLKQDYLANMRIVVPRDITARSDRTTFLARNTFVFGSVAALLIFMLILQRIVIGPLTAMREHSDRVATEGLDTLPLELSGNDEIGHLANAFDHMVSRLSDAQTQLNDASQAAGRSEVASTVIHNVGNVLTNVNSLLDAATSRVTKLRISPIDKLAAQLRIAQGKEELLSATPDYLEGLAGSLSSEQDTIRSLLGTLQDNVRHIHDVIRDQQRHASTSVSLATIQLSEIIDEAIGCCQARLDQDSVEVRVTGVRTVAVKADHSLVLQTLINVIGNARNAMSDKLDERLLVIDVQSEATMARITMVDNGCGMTEETIKKIFDAHFTTRETGSGLGLHFCANTLKKLGGAIHVSSEGLGKGAKFAIELPIAHQKQNNSDSPHASDLQVTR